jgi:hypothetical protein
MIKLLIVMNNGFERANLTKKFGNGFQNLSIGVNLRKKDDHFIQDKVLIKNSLVVKTSLLPKNFTGVCEYRKLNLKF